jgi:fructose-1,6-bisphosphatase/inositol monophosphatase family enzyme
MPDAPDASHLLRLAEDIAVEAGALLRAGLDRAREQVGTKSTGTDMVTEMDRAAEALIVERLLAARPDDGILGEEGTDRPGTSGLRWVVDPLDGTSNFLHSIPHFAISIAAQEPRADGKGWGDVIAGIVYQPITDESFWAEKSRGAWLQEGMTCNVSLFEGNPIAVELPARVVFEIVEADPVVKGQTASSSYKPAKLANGARVMVPPHIGSGTRIVVDVYERAYVRKVD